MPQDRQDSNGGGENGADKLLESLFRAGLSPAEAVDYLAVEEFGRSQMEWAAVRDRRQPSISENVDKARKKLAASTPD